MFSTQRYRVKVQCRYYSKWLFVSFGNFCVDNFTHFRFLLLIPVYFRLWVRVHHFPSTQSRTVPSCPLLAPTWGRVVPSPLKPYEGSQSIWAGAPHLTNAQTAPVWKAFPLLKKVHARPFISWEHNLGAVSKWKSDLAVWVIVKKHLGNS